MKFTKHIISGVAALAVAGTLGLAFAQTKTDQGRIGTEKSGTTMQQGTMGATTDTVNSGTSGTAGTMNNSTTNSGANATMSNDSTTGNRSTTGMANNRRMNADGTMSTELVARADRG